VFISENEVISSHPYAPTHDDDDVHVKNHIKLCLEMQSEIERRSWWY
jgi:hypothetical protein